MRTFVSTLVLTGALSGALSLTAIPLAHAADEATDCTLILPAAPLTAAGLATPFELTNTHRDETCNQLNPNQSAFVQAAILDPQTGQVSLYTPLVIDRGTQPAIAPTPPVLPPNAIVALWFGFNGENLKLRAHGFTPPQRGRDRPFARYDNQRHGPDFARFRRGRVMHRDTADDNPDNDNRVRGHACVNGLGKSLFGQFAYCNAEAFFQAANAAIKAGRLTVAPLGMANDGKACPTVRDFTTVDQDQSDNLPTSYLSYNGQVAQFNAANVAALPGAVKFGNPSDNRLVDLLLDPALGCTPFTANELSNPGVQSPALALNELQAAAFQAAPVALVPLNDPMVLVDDAYNLDKLNAYRRGVGQPIARSPRDADPTEYCRNFRELHVAKLKLDEATLSARPSPFPLMANSLHTFLAQRYVAAYELLDCRKLLRQPVNLRLVTDAAGVVTGVRY